MKAAPMIAPRPIVVLGGWRAMRFPATILASRLRSLIGNAQTLSVGFPLHFRFRTAVATTLELVTRNFPSQSPDQTASVDVVAVSMGGLIARLAAVPSRDHPRLLIARLFTLATPHRGARIAGIIRPDPTVRDMRSGSALLRSLDAALPLADYELVCYTRLGDTWVGARNTAPPGVDPIWKPGPLVLSHTSISADALILADIARRIRGEAPLAVRASPPPSQ